jgi:hypothetical protein
MMRRVAAALMLALCGCIPDALELARPDASPEGSAGAAPADCSPSCAESCNKGTYSTTCESCVKNVCAAYDERFLAAPGADTYVACATTCKDQVCWEKCCADNLQACDADMIVGSCACGFLPGGCKSDCPSLCGDSAPDTTCNGCIPLSRCALGWYDYLYHPQTEAFRLCMACEASHCFSVCCNQFPESCKLFTEMRTCVCG